MDKKKVIKELDNLIIESKNIQSNNIYYDNDYQREFVEEEIYDTFLLKIITFFKKIFKEKDNDIIKKIDGLKCNDLINLNKIEKILINVKEYIEKDYLELDIEKNNSLSFDKTIILEQIFENFHAMVRKLRDRYNDRTTIDVNDEYDVQDVLFSILQLFFDDVRKEEWTPSYAGNSSRVDFLLKKEKIVVEVKKTRSTMRDKDLGEQLIIDIAKYKVHPDCKKLICFVYDPEGRIVNPNGIKNDLEKNNEEFVKIYISPK